MADHLDTTSSHMVPAAVPPAPGHLQPLGSTDRHSPHDEDRANFSLTGHAFFDLAAPSPTGFLSKMSLEEDEDGRPDSPCLLYTSPSPRDGLLPRMPSSA